MWNVDPEFLQDLEAEPRAEIEAVIAFVAAARTALPALVAEVSRLRGHQPEVGRLRGDQPIVVTHTP